MWRIIVSRIERQGWAAFKRAYRTAVEVFLGFLTAGTVLDLDWAVVGSVTGTAFLYTFLAGTIGALPESGGTDDVVSRWLP